MASPDAKTWWRRSGRPQSLLGSICLCLSVVEFALPIARSLLTHVAIGVTMVGNGCLWLVQARLRWHGAPEPKPPPVPLVQRWKARRREREAAAAMQRDASGTSG